MPLAASKDLSPLAPSPPSVLRSPLASRSDCSPRRRLRSLNRIRVRPGGSNMVKLEEEPFSVQDAVYRLQHFLLEGVGREAQLLAAGSIVSRRDYEDVVAERSIAGLCGYPLCANPLPPDRPRKGRYRISLKEHKVYDLHETYMYCSPGCVVNSRAFEGSLQPERCAVLDSRKMEEVLRLFGDMSLGSQEEEGRVDGVGELGMSGLKIKEKEEIRAGEVPLEEWVGPSDAIEGYVPKRRDDKVAAAASSAKKEPREGKLFGDSLVCR